MTRQSTPGAAPVWCARHNDSLGRQARNSLGSVYRWLPGETATTDGLADPVRTATELAEFVAALWKIDATGGPGPEWSNAFRGVPMGDERDSIAVEARVRPKIAALQGMIDVGAVTAVWEAALAAPAWDGPPVWVHGALAQGNLLAVEGRLSAVIDFGTLAVGDPACDLLPAWKFLPAEARSAFRAALDVDDATWARAVAGGWRRPCPSPTTPTSTSRAAGTPPCAISTSSSPISGSDLV
ncbi:MAG TPA: phosphotransferase [Nonomuraea sp.]|nr:phosphotransferase [Nonomuraea sp.]